MYIVRRSIRITVACAAFFCASCTTLGPSLSVPHRALNPVGPDIAAPPVLRAVLPGTPAADALAPGDRVLTVDGAPVESIQALLTTFSSKTPTDFVVQRSDARTLTFPASTLVDPATHSWNALFVGDGETFTQVVKPPSASSVRAGYFVAGRLTGIAAASVWQAVPDLVEVQMRLDVPADCVDCQLRDIFLFDKSRNAWLSAVPMQAVAYAVIPDEGTPVQPIAVPPPTAVGSTSMTTMNGTVNAYSYGNYATGTYNGSGYTTTTPIYDYSAQNAALGYNLGAAIRNQRIAQSNQQRQAFLASRMGNLRAGWLNPGEVVSGNLFFAAPAGFPGPYFVVIDAGVNARGFVQFQRAH